MHWWGLHPTILFNIWIKNAVVCLYILNSVFNWLARTARIWVAVRLKYLQAFRGESKDAKIDSS